MAGKISKPQIKEFDQNPVEAIREIGSDVAKSLKHDLAQEAVSDLWKQILGVEPLNQKQEFMGDLKEGEEVVFSKKEKKAETEPGIDYRREIIHAETIIRKQENNELRARIEEITVELKKLSHSSKQLEVTFKDVAVETLPPAPGKYHLNFFEWMLVTIQNARMRIEDSNAWVGVVSGKKNKKDYWSLSKKHGTSFMQSGERIAATQTG